MGCSLCGRGSVPRPQTAAKTVHIAADTDMHDDSKEADKRKKRMSKETNLAKYLMKFPKINKAYRHLFMGWCEAIQKERPEGASAIFGLSGPRDQVCNALASSGIITSDDYIAKAFKNGATSTKAEGDTCTFRDLIISVCWLLKFENGEGLKKSDDEIKGSKYDEVMQGLSIVKDMFLQIDEDNSGEITYNEFKTAFAGLGDADIHERRMKELDFDNDQEITYPEFCVGIAVWVGFVEEFDNE